MSSVTPASGWDIKTRFHVDRSEGLIHAERIQDVEAILEANKILQGDRQRAETFHQIVTIPNVILEKWIHEDVINYLALPAEASRCGGDD